MPASSYNFATLAPFKHCELAAAMHMQSNNKPPAKKPFHKTRTWLPRAVQSTCEGSARRRGGSCCSS